MNIPISIHDSKKDQIAETPIDIRTEQDLDINIDLYSAGWFDGLVGLDAQLPHLKDYWNGYALGYREYCCGLLGVKIPSEEIPPDRMRTLMAA